MIQRTFKYNRNYLEILPYDIYMYILRLSHYSKIYDNVLVQLSKIDHKFIINNNEVYSHKINYGDNRLHSRYVTLKRQNNVLYFETEITHYYRENTILAIYIESIIDNCKYKINYK